MNIKKSIAIAIAKEGINHTELGRRCGLSPSTVSKQVNKEVPNMAFIMLVANELGMKVSELVALGEDK